MVDFHKRILFSDEAHFRFNGYVNKQNCRIWSEANPQVMNNHDVQELWFQQDGATCHTARATIDLLKVTFGDRLISPFGPVNWPPRSCDLTPLDYFLWGYVQSLVYADRPQTPDYLFRAEHLEKYSLFKYRNAIMTNASQLLDFADYMEAVGRR
ncbi:uncharacterized protein TNCV_3282871 [Trichonephila clavipes]|nr:uncharacterized protein TNCV_3282871 [Trichonephila clavipes]